ncbi:MAG: GldG family protein, partial [bacterium]
MRRYHKFLVNSIFMTAAVIGIVCVLYYIADRRHFRYDLTASREFSLTSQTVKILKYLDADVKITAFMSEVDPVREQASDLLNEYRYGSGRINHRFVDPEKDPAEAKKFGIRESRVVVFESGSSRKDVLESELLSRYSFNPYEQRPPEFKGEEAFTNAIIAVTARVRRKVCFVEGHGEHGVGESGDEGFSAAKDALEKENYRVEALELMKAHEIPADCDVVAVASPRKPLFSQEVKEIARFLNGGGKALVLLDPGRDAGLKNLLKRWNVIVGEDAVVDRGSMFFFGPFTPIPSYAYHDITEALRTERIATLFPLVRTVSGREENPRKGVETSELLRTSADSWAETDLESPEPPALDPGADREGPLSIAVAAERKKGKKPARLVVVGDSDFASNRVIEQAGNR